jgi:hypothetical protein
MKRALILVPCAVWCLTTPAAADTIDFEGLADLEAVTSQFPGVVFSNAVALTAGFLGGTLNELENPPHSGVTVITDDGTPMSITFLVPVLGVSAFFTYNTALTLTAFGEADNVLGSVHSSFGNNQLLSGVPGSSPNELLGLDFAEGIARILIAGSPSGDSFTLDDLTTATAIPEPGASTLLGSGVLLLVARRLRKKT